MPSPFAAWLRQVLRVVLTLSLLSCRSSSHEEEALVDATPSPGPEASAPFDVSAVMRQVHFAYRPEGTAWRGGHSTYDVRASVDGLTLTPFLHPRVEPSGEAGRRSRARLEAVKGASLTLGAVRMSRGVQQARATEARGRVEQGGHLALSREGFSEHLRNTAEGVQQEWVFEAAPGGAGDLSLTVPVQGLAFTEATGQGLHFRDAKTGLGFRYGHAAWVDALGRRTALQARYHAGTIQFRVPDALLASTAFPALLAPAISPEVGANQPVPEPQDSSQEAPSVASNGTDHLVVWEDFRGSTFEIFGARVSSAGTVLDDWGLQLSRESGTPREPAVASNGTDYLVVWVDVPPGSASTIHGARVSGAGEVRDAPTRVLGQLNQGQLSPDVASNGTDYLVVWADNRRGVLDIHGTRVTSTGTVVDAASIAISSATGVQTVPSVASNGTDYFVVWEDRRNDTPDIFGARVTSAGTVMDDSGLALSTGDGSQVTPAVASNGTDYFVAWADTRLDSAGDIFGARVTSTGTVVDGSGFSISTATQAQETPAVASNGTDYLVVWEDSRDGGKDIFGARVTSAGSVVDASGLAVSTLHNDQSLPSVASNGTDYFVAWEDARAFLDIYGTRVTSAGEVLDSAGVALSTAANGQKAPSVASNGTDYLIVWYENRQRDNTSAIFGVRVSGAGEVLDPSGLAISPSNGGHLYPVVASNGTHYLVAWLDFDVFESRVMGARITREGEILDAPGIPLSAPSSRISGEPAVASDGTGYLVVWTVPGEDTRSIISGTRVTGAGAVLDVAGLAVSGPPGQVGDPAVASNGTDYLVVWEDSRNDNSDIFGARVTSAGAVLEASGLAITTAGDTQRDPAVASNGKDYLVVWGDFRRSSASDLYGARVSGEGALLDSLGIAISTAPRYQQFPSVASLGTEYLVAWQDHRVSTPSPDIYGARVTSAGAVRESAGFELASTPDLEGTPSVVFAGTGRTAFVVYDRYDSTTPFWSHRVRGRFVTFNDNRPPVATPQGVSAVEDTPLDILLQGTDPDGQSLTYILLTNPQHGSLSGTAARRTYVPAARYRGPDRFTFRVSDGELVSAVATVSIQVSPFEGDGGVPDAGDLDAGAPDAGNPDAGVPDGGAADAGIPDAGADRDGGTQPPPSTPETSGCGCNPVPGAGPGAPLTLAVLGLLLRLSRRRR